MYKRQAEVERYRDGLSLLDPMVVLLDRVGLFDRTRAPARDAYATTSQITDFDSKLESTPGFLWMVSEGNDRATQVNAGRAYARVQLAATAHGWSGGDVSGNGKKATQQRTVAESERIVALRDGAVVFDGRPGEADLDELVDISPNRRAESD